MFALLSTLILAITVVGASDCDSAPTINGCSIPGGLSFFYKEIFRADCNKHDICYVCGKYWSVDRETCDDRFLENMKHTCNTHEEVNFESWCKVVANVYYNAVDVFGGDRYRENWEGWCTDPRYERCIS